MLVVLRIGAERARAEQLIAEARRLPGGGARLGVMLVALAARSDESGEESTVQQLVDLEAVVDQSVDLIANAGDDVANLFVLFRELGWPSRPMPDDLGQVVTMFANGVRSFDSPDAVRIALSGVMMDGCVGDGCLRVVSRVLPEQLAGNPRLVRQLAKVSAFVAVQHGTDAAWAVVGGHRQRLVELGDATFAAFLAALRDWSRAADDGARRAVLERLAGLEVDIFDDDAFGLGSARLVAKLLLGQRIDDRQILRLRSLTRGGKLREAMVPIACALLRSGRVEAGMQLADYLREGELRGRCRLCLLASQAIALDAAVHLSAWEPAAPCSGRSTRNTTPPRTRCVSTSIASRAASSRAASSCSLAVRSG